MKKNTLLYLSWVILIVILTAVITWGVTSQSLTNDSQNDKGATAIQETQDIELSGYTNERIGLEFTYPSDLDLGVKEVENGLILSQERGTESALRFRISKIDDRSILPSEYTTEVFNDIEYMKYFTSPNEFGGGYGYMLETEDGVFNFFSTMNYQNGVLEDIMESVHYLK